MPVLVILNLLLPLEEKFLPESDLDALLDSIAVSLFGNMTVETGEIHIITKE